MVDPSNYSWFHGRINRHEAEELLERAGKKDGMFLLRESTAQTGSYALSMCHNRKVIHYHIQRHSDGTVAIEDGPKFDGPVDLVQYHHHTLDGLLAKLIMPCNRLPGVQPKKYSGANQSHIQDAACAALASMGLVENEPSATLMRTKIESAIGSVMHKNQHWYHGTISRDEAERRINALGCQEGLYLVRERKEPAGSFALGLAYQGAVVHYLFDADNVGRLSIKAGPKFDNLMLAVDHYSNREDGLLCRLREPCNVEMFEGRKRTTSQGSVSSRAPVSNGDQFVQNPFLSSGKAMVPDLIAGVIKPPATAPSAHSKRLPGPPPLPATGPPSSTTGHLPGPPPLPVRPVSSGFSLPMNPKSSPIGTNSHAGASKGGNFESIYDSVKMKKSSFYYNQFKDSPTHRLKKENLTLDKELGHGNFGSVLKGEYRKPNGDILAVAVKKLKAEEANNPSSEIMHEAEVMMKLDHQNIVRIIGMCQDGSMMLVMELAPEGPLHKYLKKNKSMPMVNVLTLMLQVAEGMQYLESMQFVHRDLAARNVLVVNESFVKISDFGMSRAMGAGSDYYRAGKAGKWPLKWYAPECIYYRKFSSKSDVWSYGVTLWEATSYGTKPYQGLSGQVILEKIENDYRLPNPEGVPAEVHRIMKHCWEYSEEKRPAFARILGALYDIILNMRQQR